MHGGRSFISLPADWPAQLANPSGQPNWPADVGSQSNQTPELYEMCCHLLFPKTITSETRLKTHNGNVRNQNGRTKSLAAIVTRLSKPSEQPFAQAALETSCHQAHSQSRLASYEHVFMHHHRPRSRVREGNARECLSLSSQPPTPPWP